METLEVARAALAAGDRAAALAALLDAWRATRDPRIADLVDHVSDELVAARPPIAAATVAAFREVTEALAPADPVELGRLLAAPWPRRAEQVQRRLEVLLALPPDPRVAVTLARRIATSEWSITAARRVVELGDPRTRGSLVAWHARAQHEEGARLLAALDATVRELEAATAAAIEVIERDLAPTIATRATARRGLDDLLAAIAAEPDNLELRSVYADALIAANDPRGELAALQVARTRTGSATPTVELRERALIAAHGVTWAGAIGAYFDPETFVFEHGLFAGGALRTGKRAPPLPANADDAWRLVRVLDARLVDADALARSLPLLRRLVVGNLERAARFVAGPPVPGLAELLVDWVAELGTQLDTCASLPDLATLGMREARVGLGRFVRDAPVIERLARLVVVGDGFDREIVDALAARGGALRELVVLNTSMPISGGEGPGWTVTLRRERAPGPFTSILARHRPPKVVPSARWATSLIALLAACPPAAAELRVDAPARVLAAADRARLATAVAALAPVVAHVPWEAPPEVAATARGRAVGFELQGDGLLDEDRLAAAWQLLAIDHDQGYDLFSVGDSSTLRALGADALAKLRPWIARRTRRLHVRCDGTRARLQLDRPGRAPSAMTTTGVLECGDRSPAAIVELVVEILDLARFSSGRVALDLRTVVGTLARYHDAPMDGWLMVFGDPELVSRLPLAEVEELARRPELAGMFAVASRRRYLVVGVAPTPEEATLERARAVARALGEVLARRLPFDPGARASAVFDELARDERLAIAPTTAVLEVRFASTDDRWIAIELQLRDPFRALQTQVVVTWSPAGQERRWCWLDYVATPDAASFDALLRRHAETIRAQLRVWFAET